MLKKLAVLSLFFISLIFLYTVNKNQCQKIRIRVLCCLKLPICQIDTTAMPKCSQGFFLGKFGPLRCRRTANIYTIISIHNSTNSVAANLILNALLQSTDANLSRRRHQHTLQHSLCLSKMMTKQF